MDEIDRLLDPTRIRARAGQFADELRKLSIPVYADAGPEHPNLVVEIRPDGTRRVGRFVDRRFVSVIPAGDGESGRGNRIP